MAYLQACKKDDVAKFELAARIFPIERNIALAPALYFLKHNEQNEQSLSYINQGLKFDPYAADLLRAKMMISYKLGKSKEALDAYDKLSTIASNNKMVKCLSEASCSFNPN